MESIYREWVHAVLRKHWTHFSTITMDTICIKIWTRWYERNDKCERAVRVVWMLNKNHFRSIDDDDDDECCRLSVFVSYSSSSICQYFLHSRLDGFWLAVMSCRCLVSVWARSVGPHSVDRFFLIAYLFRGTSYVDLIIKSQLSKQINLISGNTIMCTIEFSCGKSVRIFHATYFAEKSQTKIEMDAKLYQIVCA